MTKLEGGNKPFHKYCNKVGFFLRRSEIHKIAIKTAENANLFFKCPQLQRESEVSGHVHQK